MDAIIGIGNLASASGLPDDEQCFDLLFLALALADRHSENGCARETFLKMAGVVHDKLRGALASGEPT